MIRIRTAALLCMTALSLAACGKTGKETAGEDPQTALNDASEVAFQLQPGKYRTTVSVEKIEIPGMPAAMADQMKAMMDKAASEESCVTPERAARGLDVMKEQMARGKCRFERFTARDGKLDSAFTCQTGDGMTMQASSSGTYSETGSSLRVDGQLSGPGGKTMHVVQTVKTERVGDCT